MARVSPCPRARLLPPWCWCAPSGRACCLNSISALPEISRVFGRPSPGPWPAAAQGGAGWPSQLLAGPTLGKEQVRGCRGGARGETWPCQEWPCAKGQVDGHCLRPHKLLLTLGKGTRVHSPWAKWGPGGAGGWQWQQRVWTPHRSRNFLSSGVKLVASGGQPCPLRGSFLVFPNFSTILMSLWGREVEGGMTGFCQGKHGSSHSR